MHPRLSVNSLSSARQSLEDDIAMWGALGVGHVGLISPKLAAAGWDRSAELVAAAGLKVSNISSENSAVTESLRFASAVGAGVVYVCSGPPAPSRAWTDSERQFRAEMAPPAAMAAELGVRLAVEPTNPLRSDVSFVFCVRDALALADAAGIDIVVDLYSCWYERDLDAMVRDRMDAVALVQVCDYALGTFDTPNRSVPGDGDIPIERLLSVIDRAGYRGPFDLEVLGPRIEAEGYGDAVRRSVERMSAIIDRLAPAA